MSTLVRRLAHVWHTSLMVRAELDPFHCPTGYIVHLVTVSVQGAQVVSIGEILTLDYKKSTGTS